MLKAATGREAWASRTPTEPAASLSVLGDGEGGEGGPCTGSREGLPTGMINVRVFTVPQIPCNL